MHNAASYRNHNSVWKAELDERFCNPPGRVEVREDRNQMELPLRCK
ncbi:MAG TPA: hypothetical protein QF468_05380 [Nitrospinota bacterium]|nr:hypothetical protein [Nitrospinota bacterium]